MLFRCMDYVHMSNPCYNFSEFVFDPAKWPRDQMDEDFLKLGKMFNAMRSVVRVPNLDPKYKIAVLASKQVLSANQYGNVIANLTNAIIKIVFIRYRFFVF